MAIQLTPELQDLLMQAAQRKASDLHLIVGEPPVFRVGGTLVRTEQNPLTDEDLEGIVHAAVGDQQAARIGPEFGEIITTCSLDGLVEGRMCITRSLEHFTATIRLLPSQLPSPASTRIPEALLEATNCPHGLILITGLTGSGKNTVALVLLEYINAHRPAQIITIEDPVAVHLTPKQGVIRQQSVGTDTPSFHAALRTILRLDPDVIYVSEVRDLMTLQACITVAQVGHLVVAVMHSSSPQDAIRRMIEAQPEEMRPVFRRSLAETLRAVAMSYLLPEAKGSGRVAAIGLLLPDQALRQAIIAGQEIMNWPLPPGSQALADDIERLHTEGRVTDQAVKEVLERIGQA